MWVSVKVKYFFKRHKILVSLVISISVIYLFVGYKTVVNPECSECGISVEPTNGTPSDYFIEPQEQDDFEFEEISSELIDGEPIKTSHENPTKNTKKDTQVSLTTELQIIASIPDDNKVLPTPSLSTNVLGNSIIIEHKVPSTTQIYEKRNTFGLLIDELMPSKEMSPASTETGKQNSKSKSNKSIFDNASYRNYTLSKDLSRWRKYLSLSEDDPHVTNFPMFADIPKTERPIKKALTSTTIPKKRYHTSNRLYEITRNTVRPNMQSSVTKSSVKRRNQFAKKKSPSIFPYQLDYSRMSYYPWKSTGDDCSKYATRFLRKGSGQLIPLASYPGSGNTWLRYISESLTGVFTGSLYIDDELTKKGFWGEQDFYMEGTTLLQKAHSIPVLPEDNFGWKGQMILGPPPRKVVLLIRSPYDAMISLRHFHVAGHVGIASSHDFIGDGWYNFTLKSPDDWFNVNKAWLELPDTFVHIIHYEKLLKNLPLEASKLLKFLGIPEDSGRLSCLLRYPDGHFRRPRHSTKLPKSPFPIESINKTNEAMQKMNSLLKKHGKQKLPVHLYKWRTSL